MKKKVDTEPLQDYKEPETPQNRGEIIDIKELSKADELLEWTAHRNWAFD